MNFANWPLAWKISIPVAVVLIFTIGLSAVSLSSLHSAMLEERLTGTKNIALSAVTIAAKYHELEKAGQMSAEEAQSAAKLAIGAMRFDNGNYLFIYDEKGIALAHPKASLVGKDMSGVKDKDGVFIVKELIKIANAGGGSLLYQWPRAGSEIAIDKHGWGEGFKPWGWMIGTGVYVDDLEAAFWSQAMLVLVIAAVGAVAAFVIALATIRGITGPVRSLTSSMNTLAQGDSSVVVEGAERGDEIGQMAKAMEVFVANEQARKELEHSQRDQQEASIRRGEEVQRLSGEFDSQITAMMSVVEDSVRDLQSASQDMSAGAARTTEQSDLVSSASAQAASNVETVAAAAEELSASVNEIRRQVQSSSEIASQAADEASATNQRMNGLSEAAGRIGEVVTLIQAIAEQTNLLALNATIEAARAGEAGKGFAVVAAEVKELANQTSKATEEISSQISAIQGETTDAAAAISSVTEIINQMNEIAASISAAVDEQGAATQEIASNATEASRGTMEVTTNISSVSEAAGNTRAAAETVDQSANHLEDNAQQLRAQVAEFLSNVRAQSAA